MNPPPAPPVHTKDSHGNPVVLVHLADGERVATVDEADYNELKAVNAHRPWLWNEAGHGIGYVRLAAYRFPGRLETVARLIMRPPPGYVVAYRSQDHLDLRRSNLYLRSGKTRRGPARRARTAAAFVPSASVPALRPDSPHNH